MLRRQCLSRTRHQFVPSLYPGHVITYSRKLPFLSTNSPSAEWRCIADRKYPYRILWGDFPSEWHFFTKLGPQVSLFPVPIFGVNREPRWRSPEVVIVSSFTALSRFLLFLTILSVFPGLSSGTPLLHRPQLRPCWAIPRDRPTVPTPLAHATTTLPPVGSRRSSSGSTSASSYWRPSTVNLVICLILTQLWTNRHCSVIATDRDAELN
jgi:hypothetical protein